MLRAIFYALIALTAGSILAAKVATWFAPQNFASVFVGDFVGGVIALFILAGIWSILQWRQDKRKIHLGYQTELVQWHEINKCVVCYGPCNSNDSRICFSCIEIGRRYHRWKIRRKLLGGFEDHDWLVVNEE